MALRNGRSGFKLSTSHLVVYTKLEMLLSGGAPSRSAKTMFNPRLMLLCITWPDLTHLISRPRTGYRTSRCLLLPSTSFILIDHLLEWKVRYHLQTVSISPAGIRSVPSHWLTFVRAPDFFRPYRKMPPGVDPCVFNL